MGKSQRDKGARFEREIVNAAREQDLDAFRVPLSGAANGFKDDVVLRDCEGIEWRLEAKKRADGFKQIYQWLGEADALVIGADRRPALAVIPLTAFLDLLNREMAGEGGE